MKIAMGSRGILALAALSLTACVDTSARIAGALREAGLDEVRAECVGRSLEGDLSLNQIRQLAAAARAYRAHDDTPGRFTVSDLMRVSAQVRDPAVPMAVARAAGRCA